MSGGGGRRRRRLSQTLDSAALLHAQSSDTDHQTALVERSRATLGEKSPSPELNCERLWESRACSMRQPARRMADAGRKQRLPATTAAATAIPLLAALALLLALPCGAFAQMVTPLRGQGSPEKETTEVFLSCYLDRLLEVDDTHSYRFTAILYFYLTWRDPSAFAKVANATQAMRASGGACPTPCTDWAGDVSCCSDIWMPTFFFRNAHSFPQDRATGYKLYALPPPNGSVLWTQFVHGVFYQPMSLRHYPFDSFDLAVVLEFLDTAGPDHPGVTVRLSSGGKLLYTYGKGDALSQWGVQSLSMQVLPSINSVAWFRDHSDIPSHPSDPLGLTTTPSARLRGACPGNTSLQAARGVTQVVVKVRIYRYWRYNVLNTVLPVLLLGLLSFVVFFIERKDLATRLGVVVTLFLAMAAVQFVISDHSPESSYVLPTQQLSIATYVLLALINANSILVYAVETWKQSAEAAERRRRAREHHRAKRRRQHTTSTEAAAEAAVREVVAEQAAAAAGGGAAEGEGSGRSLSLSMPDKGEAGSPPQTPDVQAPPPLVLLAEVEEAPAFASGQAPPGSPPGRQLQTSGRRSLQTSPPSTRWAAVLTSPSFGRLKLARLESLRGVLPALPAGQDLQEDAEYDAYVAWVIDRSVMALLFVGYIATAICIFALQSGYIDIFAI